MLSFFKETLIALYAIDRSGTYYIYTRNTSIFEYSVCKKMSLRQVEQEFLLILVDSFS